jgi:hypothetical protein
MTHDSNMPPHQGYPQQPQPQPQQSQFGQYPQPYPPATNQPYPQQHPSGQPPQPPFGRDALPPLPTGPGQPRKGPFGPSFWIVAAILAVLVLVNAFAGQGEGILFILGVSAALTGLYSLIFKRRSWGYLTNRRIAAVVTFAGVASLLLGVTAGVASVSRDARAEAARLPVTSAQLEADAAAKLKVREDALVKSEADSAAKLKTREDAVAARESAAGTVAAQVASNTIGQGIWTVSKDMPPGTYRTTKAVTPKKCSWKITVTGSNGSDYIDTDYFVSGGFPTVTLAEGQSFDSDGCGDWTKQ